MTDGLTSLELAGLVLSFEFLIVACAVPAIGLIRGRSQAHAEANDAREMLETVEQGEGGRREALATIFKTTYQLDDEQLEARVDEFIEREQAFYQVMTSVYLDRDSSRLKDIPAELTKVISPWVRMTPGAQDASGAVADLEQANGELSAELEQTRQRMDELMQEYLKAFDKEGRAIAAAEAAAEVEAGAEGAQESDADVAADDPPSAESAFGESAASGETAVRPTSAEDVEDEIVFDVAEESPQEVAAADDLADGDDDLVFDVAEDSPEDATAAGGESAEAAAESAADTDEAAMNQDEVDALANLFDEEIAALEDDEADPSTAAAA